MLLLTKTHKTIEESKHLLSLQIFMFSLSIFKVYFILYHCQITAIPFP